MEETLGTSLLRTSRSKVVPLEVANCYEGYEGERDGSNLPHGRGTLAYSDGSLLWMGGSYHADTDGLGNGIYEGQFVHGKV